MSIHPGRIRPPLPPPPPPSPSVATKGRYMKALCAELRRLIPDGQPITLDMGDGTVCEVDGFDIQEHLMALMMNVPDTSPVIDTRPCENETWEDDEC